jgi:hypothetical protein
VRGLTDSDAASSFSSSSRASTFSAASSRSTSSTSSARSSCFHVAFNIDRRSPTTMHLAHVREHELATRRMMAPSHAMSSRSSRPVTTVNPTASSRPAIRIHPITTVHRTSQDPMTTIVTPPLLPHPASAIPLTALAEASHVRRCSSRSATCASACETRSCLRAAFHSCVDSGLDRFYSSD